MTRFVLSPAAVHDIEEILVWSHEQFGEQARLRYEALLIQGIQDIANDPQRAGSHARPEIADSIRTYHLRHSRDHVGASTGRVGHPRHFLLFRVQTNGQVEIARVLHDSMDLQRHLLEDNE